MPGLWLYQSHRELTPSITRPLWRLSYGGYPLSDFAFEDNVLLGVCVGAEKLTPAESPQSDCPSRSVLAHMLDPLPEARDQPLCFLSPSL